jgi:hypothetical protein
MARLHTALILFAAWFAAAQTVAAPPALVDAVFEPGFEAVLQAEPTLLREGGARIVEWEGARYFLAVGVTSVREQATASERLRQMRVGRINALRAVAEFMAPTEVKTETTLRETTVIRRENGTSNGETRKTLDETTRTKVEAILQSPQQVGSWKSADGRLFFYALGAKLP